MEGSTPIRARAALSAVVDSWESRYGLTPAEARVAREMVRGLGNKEIGNLIGVSTATVRSQVCAVLRKLGIDSRTRLAYFAFRDSISRGEP